MAKIQRFDDPDLEVPPEFLPLIAKIIRWFDNQIYPVWGMAFLGLTRSSKARSRAHSYLRAVGTAWKALDQAVRDAWGVTADFIGLNGYQLFTSDYSYRRKNDLSLPGTPHALHQMQGLKIACPGGSGQVRAEHQSVDSVGQITVAFNYKKVQTSPPSNKSFYFKAVAWYFEGGLNKKEEHEWESPAGNVDWTAVSRQFGTADRKYFHLLVTFYLDDYDAEVYLDDLLITDKTTDIYKEGWKVKAGRVWAPQMLYRKEGWVFTPSYTPPQFDFVYLG